MLKCLPSALARLLIVSLAVLVRAPATGQEQARNEVDPWKLPPEKGITLSGYVAWQSKPHWILEDSGTMLAALEQDYVWTSFVVNAPDKRHVWYHEFDLPIDWQRYPFLVIRYRAWNTNPKSEDYLLAVPETDERGRRMKTLIAHNELKPDGTAREVRKDLRGLQLTGPLRGIALEVIVDRYVDAPAVLQLDSVFFLAADSGTPAAPLAAHGTVTVRVTDEVGNPVPEALVVADAERLNFARAGQTDEQGIARVSPLQNDAGVHMLRVEHEKDAYAPVEVRQVDPDRQGTLEIQLMRGVKYGGTITKADKQPVADAVVRLALTVDAPLGLRVQKRCSVTSNSEGKWQTPTLPALPRGVEITVFHPECRAYTQTIAEDDPLLEQLRTRKASFCLSKGSSAWDATIHYPSVQSVLDEGTLEDVQELACDRTEPESMRLTILGNIDRRLAGAQDLIADSIPFYLRLAAEADSRAIAELAMTRALGCLRARDGGLGQARGFIQGACQLYPGDTLMALADAKLKAWQDAVALRNVPRQADLPVSRIEVVARPTRQEGVGAGQGVGVVSRGSQAATPGAAGGIQLASVGSRRAEIPGPISIGGREGPRAAATTTVAVAPAATAPGSAPASETASVAPATAPAGGQGRAVEVATAAPPSRESSAPAGVQVTSSVPREVSGAVLVSGSGPAAGMGVPLPVEFASPSRFVSRMVASVPSPAVGIAVPVAAAETAPAGTAASGAIVVASRPDAHQDSRAALPAPTRIETSGPAQRAAALDALLLRPRCQAIQGLIAEGKYPEAQAQCRELLREFTLSPQSSFTVIQLVADAYAGELGEDHAKVTAAVLRELEANHPDRELALFYTALYWYRRGVDQMAITQLDQFQKECAQSPLIPKSLLTEALCYIRMNQKEQALVTLEALLEQFPAVEEIPKALFLVGWLHLTAQEYGKARPPLAAVVQKYPGTEFASKAAQLLQRLP